ncbi:uncharacterized protein EI97DRAFT_476713 [Westerdykella ornata]|uniref:Uncharacterized protein n=1 Tax=Westerdykella ornata TaxID=318751 RepID=A0A6A6JFC7_WESOR|nr:uncharacterized protein EI97DRAFT_476713 [Westerdykella ornata]KAF2274698.1 hypothetical protein EI97DRAFT_476713 [Westerdykella ornata]
MASPTFYLLKPERVEPASDALSWLGRITQNPAAPDANFTPIAPQRLLARHPTSETEIANATAFNHQKALDALCEDEGVRRDLARMLRPGGEPAYFIVGMLIWQDATFVDRRVKARGVGASLELPVSMAVAATTGVVIPIHGMMDPSVGSGEETARERAMVGFSEGSHIFALEYRTVRRRIFSLGRDFTPKLGGYGGRVQKDSVFGHHDAATTTTTPTTKGDGSSAESNAVIVLDDEGDEWLDDLHEPPEVETLCGVSIAYDSTVKS